MDNKIKFTEVPPYQFDRMRNGTHYALMAYMQKKVQSYSSENAELKTYLSQFNETVKAEFELLSVPRKSNCTEEIRTADLMRDRLYTRFKLFVLASATLPDLPEYEAAMRIKKQIDTSNISSKWRLGQKTGILTKFIATMEADGFKEDVDTLGLTQTIVQLKEQNELVLTKLMERSDEFATFKEKALKNARKATEQAFYELTNHLEAMCCFLKDEKLGNIIEACNVEIKRSIVEATYHNKAKEEDTPSDQQPNGNEQGQQQDNITDVRPEPVPQPEGQGNQTTGQDNQPDGSANTPGNQPQPKPEDKPGNPTGGTSPTPSEEHKDPGKNEANHSSSGIITDARPA